MLPRKRLKQTINSDGVIIFGTIWSKNESALEYFLPKYPIPNRIKETIGFNKTINFVLYFPWNIFWKEKWAKNSVRIIIKTKIVVHKG